MAIKRYEMMRNTEVAWMEPSDTGEYVTFSDHSAAVARLMAVVEAAREMRNAVGWDYIMAIVKFERALSGLDAEGKDK